MKYIFYASLTLLFAVSVFAADRYDETEITRNPGGEVRDIGLYDKSRRLRVTISPFVSQGESFKSYAKVHLFSVSVGTIDGDMFRLTGQELVSNESKFNISSGRFFVKQGDQVVYEVESREAIESLHIHAESYSAKLDLVIHVENLDEDVDYSPNPTTPTNPTYPPVNPYEPPVDPTPPAPQCEYSELTMKNQQLNLCLSQKNLNQREVAILEDQVMWPRYELNYCQEVASNIRSRINRARSAINSSAARAQRIENEIASKQEYLQFIRMVQRSAGKNWRCQVTRPKFGSGIAESDEKSSLGEAIHDAIVNKCGRNCLISSGSDAKKHKFKVIPYGNNKTINCRAI